MTAPREVTLPSMVTVADLIEALRQMPQDLAVVYQTPCSDKMPSKVYISPADYGQLVRIT